MAVLRKFQLPISIWFVLKCLLSSSNSLEDMASNNVLELFPLLHSGRCHGNHLERAVLNKTLYPITTSQQ